MKKRFRPYDQIRAPPSSKSSSSSSAHSSMPALESASDSSSGRDLDPRDSLQILTQINHALRKLDRHADDIANIPVAASINQLAVIDRMDEIDFNCAAIREDVRQIKDDLAETTRAILELSSRLPTPNNVPSLGK